MTQPLQVFKFFTWKQKYVKPVVLHLSIYTCTISICPLDYCRHTWKVLKSFCANISVVYFHLKFLHFYIHIRTYTHICNIYFILLHINNTNFVCRNRTIFYFFNFFNKSFLNDVFCDNANPIIFTCWTYITDIFP